MFFFLYIENFRRKETERDTDRGNDLNNFLNRKSFMIRNKT